MIKKFSILKTIFLLIAIILVIHLLYSLNKLIRTENLNDFQVYFQAAKTSLSGNPYAERYFAPYNYPPSATIFFLPLLLLPFQTAEAFWIVLSVSSFLFSFFIISKLFLKKTSLVLKFLGAVLLLRTFPARFTLVLGQVNLIILALILFSFYFFQKRRAVWAGFLLAVASAIKLTPLLLGLFYFLKKEKKILIIFLTSFLFFNLISVILFGWQNFYYYFRIVLPLVWQSDASRGLKLDYFNQSLESLLLRLNLESSPRLVIRWLTVTFFLGILAKKIVVEKKPLENFKSFSQLFIITSIFIPSLVWQHHYVFLFPALLVLGFYLARDLSLPKAFLLLFFFAAFYFHFKKPNSPLLQNPILASHHFLSALFLWFTIFLIRGKE